MPHTYVHFPMGRYLASVGFACPAFNGDFLNYEKIFFFFYLLFNIPTHLALVVRSMCGLTGSIDPH